MPFAVAVDLQLTARSEFYSLQLQTYKKSPVELLLIESQNNSFLNLFD